MSDMDSVIDKAIDELTKYSEKELSPHEKDLLIKGIAELHQVRCKLNINELGATLPIEYSLDWARACIFLQNE